MTPAVSPPLYRGSVADTLGLVERVVWSLLFVATAALLGAALVGAVVLSSRPLGVPAVALLLAAVGGTVVFVAADVVFG
jgi:hypothetical protein